MSANLKITSSQECDATAERHEDDRLTPIIPEGLEGSLHRRPSLESNPAAVYLASLAQGSRRTMHAALDIIAGLLTSQRANAFSIRWSYVRFQHTAAIRSQLAEKYSAATANKMLAALRGTLKAAWRLGQMDAEEYHRACDIGSVTGERLPAGRSLSAGELVALIAACVRKEGTIGIRDAAILSLLYGCGLRRAELVALRFADYDAGAGTLKIHGKRNKQRLSPVVGGAADALDDWISVRGVEEGALFVPVLKNGRVVHRPLTTQAIYKLLLMRAKEASVVAFSPHDFRRTFVGDLLDRGADIVTVQKLAGHANVTTTARYDRRGDTTKRRAAEMLHVPYLRRPGS